MAVKAVNKQRVLVVDDSEATRTYLRHFLSAREIERISANPRMQRMPEVASLVAEADVPVLISGESGVGKEVVARLIHTRSTRRNQPFVKVNCAALPDGLLESELFGYERGA